MVPTQKRRFSNFYAPKVAVLDVSFRLPAQREGSLLPQVLPRAGIAAPLPRAPQLRLCSPGQGQRGTGLPGHPLKLHRIFTWKSVPLDSSFIGSHFGLQLVLPPLPRSAHFQTSGEKTHC